MPSGYKNFCSSFYTVEFCGMFLRTRDAAALACALWMLCFRDLKIQNTVLPL